MGIFHGKWRRLYLFFLKNFFCLWNANLSGTVRRFFSSLDLFAQKVDHVVIKLFVGQLFSLTTFLQILTSAKMTKCFVHVRQKMFCFNLKTTLLASVWFKLTHDRVESQVAWIPVDHHQDPLLWRTQLEFKRREYFKRGRHSPFLNVIPRDHLICSFLPVTTSLKFSYFNLFLKRQGRDKKKCHQQQQRRRRRRRQWRLRLIKTFFVLPRIFEKEIWSCFNYLVNDLPR